MSPNLKTTLPLLLTAATLAFTLPLIVEKKAVPAAPEHPRLTATQTNTLRTLAPRLNNDTFQSLSSSSQTRLLDYATSRLQEPPAFALCWSPGGEPGFIEALHAIEETANLPGSLSNPGAATQTPDNFHWQCTATDGSFQNQQGLPITLTWHIVADGTPIQDNIPTETDGPSELRARLIAIFGSNPNSTDPRDQPWFPIFQDMFDNWSEITGVNYVYEPNDDGVIVNIESFASRGVLGTRADIRICGHSVDGPGVPGASNILAYNYFSFQGGDMVIDTDNMGTSPVRILANSFSDFRFLRNTLAHEHGHGLGMRHVCPLNNTKLMEPRISSAFLNTQLDDIFTVNRLYGDFYEKQNTQRNNDSAARASTLPLTVATPFSRDYLSIDDNDDIDFYRLNSLTTGQRLTARIIPVETPAGFVEGEQDSEGDCTDGTPFDFTSIHNLTLDIFPTSGSTPLASANANPAGQIEEIIEFEIPSDGTYFIRVNGDTTNFTQLYTLQLTLQDPLIIPDSPDNLTATRAGNDSVTLTWDDQSSNETNFVVERRDERGSPWLPITTLPADTTTFTDTGAPAGINLYYRIIARAEADSAPSNERVFMLVDLTADSYLYDLGRTQDSPIEPGAFRMSAATRGDLFWSGSMTSRDRGGPDPANRDYLRADSARTLTHRIANGFWQITTRQGDQIIARDELTIAAEGVTQVTGINSAINEYVENTFIIEVTDDFLDLTFDDAGGIDGPRWVLNRLFIERSSPYQAWAASENLPASTSAPDQDADDDGLLNLQEYFFGQNPLVAQTTSPTNITATNRFTFLRDPTAQVSTFRYEISDDLTTWIPYTPPEGDITTTPVGNLEETQITLPDLPIARYLRIVLEP